ncbi:MAG: hypothetical protein IKU88_02820 [Alistipes sp.]|nr:hypothetical protein [Alistipes sp.]
MKKILFCLIAAMFLAACEKDTPEQPAQPDPVPETNVVAWNYPPTSLPENIEQILTGSPLWLTDGHAMDAKVEDGKITVVNTNAGNDGEFLISAWSFAKDECTTYYMNTAIQKMRTWKEEWNKQMIIDYKDGVITLSLNESAKLVNNPNLIRVYSIRVATQQEYDQIMSLLEE